MSHHEQTPTSTFHFEQATVPQLHAAFDMLQSAASTTDLAIEPTPELHTSVNESSATPFRAIESLSITSAKAEYDATNNTVYPETVTLQVHGWYGDIDANERSLAYTLVHDPIENTYDGFVLQSFHNSDSYPLETQHAMVEFARTIAAHTQEYKQTIDHCQPDFSTGDFKRTAELRPMDTTDLDLLAAAIAHQQL